MGLATSKLIWSLIRLCGLLKDSNTRTTKSVNLFHTIEILLLASLYYFFFFFIFSLTVLAVHFALRHSLVCLQSRKEENQEGKKGFIR